jgi:hypothetical protein
MGKFDRIGVALENQSASQPAHRCTNAPVFRFTKRLLRTIGTAPAFGILTKMPPLPC